MIRSKNKLIEIATTTHMVLWTMKNEVNLLDPVSYVADTLMSRDDHNFSRTECLAASAAGAEVVRERFSKPRTP